MTVSEIEFLWNNAQKALDFESEIIVIPYKIAADIITKLKTQVKELEGTGICFWCEEIFTNEVSDEEIFNHYKTCEKHPVFQLEAQVVILKEKYYQMLRITGVSVEKANEAVQQALQGGE